MRADTVKPIISSFLSCDKDTELILKKLFVDCGVHSEKLKRLLLINTKDCLDNKESKTYREVLQKYSVKKMIEDSYIRLQPLVRMPEHEEVKSYIIISFDGFSPNMTNPEFRDCTVHFDIICHTDYWDIGNYRQRPLMIAGYIDGLLNNTRLTGIGRFNFAGCNELINGTISGYTLSYRAIHGSDDIIPAAPI